MIKRTIDHLFRQISLFYISAYVSTVVNDRGISKQSLRSLFGKSFFHAWAFEINIDGFRGSLNEFI